MFLLFTFLIAFSQARTCCETNTDKITVLEDLLQAVENDLDDKFRFQFDLIDDRIIAIEN